MSRLDWSRHLWSNRQTSNQECDVAQGMTLRPWSYSESNDFACAASATSHQTSLLKFQLIEGLKTARKRSTSLPRNQPVTRMLTTSLFISLAARSSISPLAATGSVSTSILRRSSFCADSLTSCMDSPSAFPSTGAMSPQAPGSSFIMDPCFLRP